MKKLALLLLAVSSVYAQEGTPVKSLFGAGPPNANLAHVIGTQYIDTTTSLLYVCTAVTLTATVSSCTWTAPGGAAATTTKVIYAADPTYGGKFDVRYESDCTFVNTSTTVVCPSGKFTSADIGKIEFGTVSLQTHGSGLLIATPVIVAQGTITGVTNATTATVSIASTANCTGSLANLCWFAWGTQDDTTALAAAQTAAWNNGPCLTLQLPAGAMFVSAGGLGALTTGQGNACTGATDFNQSGPELAGMGQGATVIIPLPSFNFATCTNGVGGNSCFGGAGALRIHDLQINGLGNSLPSTTHANNLLELSGVTTFWNTGICTAASASNLRLAHWGLQSTNLVGILVSQTCDADLVNVTNEDFGTGLCNINVGPTTSNTSAVGLVCFGGLTYSLRAVSTGGTFSSSGGYYGGCLAGGCDNANFVTDSGVGILDSSGDMIFGVGSNAQNMIHVSSTGNSHVNLWGDSVILPTGTLSTSQVLFANATASTTSIAASTLVATGVNNRLFITNAGNSIIDVGGNVFTNGTIANTLTGGFFGTYSATGVAQTAGNWSTPAGAGAGQWGTSPSIACPGTLETSAGSSNFEACTITVGSGTVGANPVLTVTWPVAFMVAPNCQAQMTGGTAALATITTGAVTTTSGVFTYQGTPAASSTMGIQITCGSL